MKKFRFYSGLINLQIKWLDKMSDKGYRLVSTGKLWYEFEPCKPSAYRYAIDYVGDKSRAEAKEYADFLEDIGYRTYFKNINLNLDLGDLVWEKFADKGDFFADRATAMDRALLIVEKENDGKPFELHTTYEDRALFYRKLMMPYLLLFLLFAALGLFTKMWGWFAAAAVFLFVCIVYLIDHLKMKKMSSLIEG
ncbi:MAG: DUF2812 domain-containing protein [Lachnospiraceae bacterium]|nr:DUF2812 domain-containing protein [Lachnospiraceae bacterium]